jgi:hypothetical protein
MLSLVTPHHRDELVDIKNAISVSVGFVNHSLDFLVTDVVA